VFRFDTSDDESFWGGTLRLHQAIEVTRFGGVGPSLSPRTALAVGLKVDVDALPKSLFWLNLDDPAMTLQLLRLNAVLGITELFDGRATTLRPIGSQCSLCHLSAVESKPASDGRIKTSHFLE
jgi:hypothetical protein